MKKTSRGFNYLDFTDLYGSKYSIQKSSLATQDAIWLGIDNANPKIMCRDAIKLGLREQYNDERDNGWCEYKIPNTVLLTNRMHLNQEQAKELVKHLNKFIKTGDL